MEPHGNSWHLHGASWNLTESRGTHSNSWQPHGGPMTVPMALFMKVFIKAIILNDHETVMAVGGFGVHESHTRVYCSTGRLSQTCHGNAMEAHEIA